MKKYLLLLLLCPLLHGCASGSDSSKDTSSSAGTDPNGNKVSNVPWNKPQPWEQGGQLGSAMGH